MDRKTADEIWEQVKANRARLDDCNRHDFSEDITPEKQLGKAWKCTNCGGTVDSMAKNWYERGLQHGQ